MMEWYALWDAQSRLRPIDMLVKSAASRFIAVHSDWSWLAPSFGERACANPGAAPQTTRTTARIRRRDISNPPELGITQKLTDLNQRVRAIDRSVSLTRSEGQPDGHVRGRRRASSRPAEIPARPIRRSLPGDTCTT